MPRTWLKYAMIRCVKTVAQTAISLITVGQAFTEVDWLTVGSVSLTAGILSLLTSLAGIPEAKEGE